MHPVMFVCISALLALSPVVADSSLEGMGDQLTLESPLLSPNAQDEATRYDDLERVSRMEVLTVPEQGAREFPAESDLTNMSGVDFADLKNSVYALALRDQRGLGFGVASSGGLAITGGFATKSGLQVSLYYVERVRDLETAARVVGIEDLPARTIGLTLKWKF